MCAWVGSRSLGLECFRYPPRYVFWWFPCFHSLYLDAFAICTMSTICTCVDSWLWNHRHLLRQQYIFGTPRWAFAELFKRTRRRIPEGRAGCGRAGMWCYCIPWDAWGTRADVRPARCWESLPKARRPKALLVIIGHRSYKTCHCWSRCWEFRLVILDEGNLESLVSQQFSIYSSLMFFASTSINYHASM